jgi:hypothetical protein
MKAEETKKLDAMMEIPAAPTKTKGKKKKKSSKAPPPSEPEQPPPQDELPISLPPTPGGPGMRVIYPDRQIPKEGATQTTTADEDKGVGSDDHTHVEEGVRGSEAGDSGEREEEEEEEEESESEEGEEKKEEEVAAKKKLAQEKKETATDLISDTYNGGVLDNYKWSQTMTDVDVKVPIAPGTRAKDVTVEIKNDHLKVVLHKPEKKVQ